MRWSKDKIVFWAVFSLFFALCFALPLLMPRRSGFLGTAAVYLAGMGLFLGLQTWVGMWEKRLAWPYVASEETATRKIAAATDDFNERNDDAASAGFALLGTFGHGGGDLYDARYTIRRSADGAIMAVLSCGKIASMPVKGIWLISRLENERRLVTLNRQNASSPDLLGLTDETLLPGASFEALVRQHRARLAQTPFALAPFAAEDPLEDYRAFRIRHTQGLVRDGYAVFLDDGQTGWRYRPKGAFLLAVRQIATLFRRALLPDAFLRGVAAFFTEKPA